MNISMDTSSAGYANRTPQAISRKAATPYSQNTNKQIGFQGVGELAERKLERGIFLTAIGCVFAAVIGSICYTVYNDNKNYGKIHSKSLPEQIEAALNWKKSCVNAPSILELTMNNKKGIEANCYSKLIYSPENFVKNAPEKVMSLVEEAKKCFLEKNPQEKNPQEWAFQIVNAGRNLLTNCVPRIVEYK